MGACSLGGSGSATRRRRRDRVAGLVGEHRRAPVTPAARASAIEASAISSDAGPTIQQAATATVVRQVTETDAPIRSVMPSVAAAPAPGRPVDNAAGQRQRGRPVDEGQRGVAGPSRRNPVISAGDEAPVRRREVR